MLAVRLCLATIGLVGVINCSLADERRTYPVVSTVMWPTFSEGVTALADPIYDRERDLRLGNIVLAHVRNSTQIFRIVAREGDTVQVKSGRLHRNGEAVPRTAVQPRKPPAILEIPREVPCYLETIEQRNYEICETSGDRSRGDNTEVFTVPAGHLFLMGDNRDNSNDSRFSLGFVPVGSVTGVVRAIDEGGYLRVLDSDVPSRRT